MVVVDGVEYCIRCRIQSLNDEVFSSFFNYEILIVMSVARDNTLILHLYVRPRHNYENFFFDPHQVMYTLTLYLKCYQLGVVSSWAEDIVLPNRDNMCISDNAFQT